jgi:predicted ArsR family transcriptional regulator
VKTHEAQWSADLLEEVRGRVDDERLANILDEGSTHMKRHEVQWLVDLLKEVEGHVDEERLANILEGRGRACIGATYINKAKDAAKNAKDVDEFLDNLATAVRMLKREGDKVYMVYPKCYCHKLKGVKGDVPGSYCYCSVGWVKEMFEQALGRPVEVKLEASVLRGDEACRLRVLV